MLLLEKERYAELVAAEERLKLIEKALGSCNLYSGDIHIVKTIFAIDEKKGTNK